MTYTIDEAAEMLDLSYSAVYRYVKDFNLGGDGKKKELNNSDLEFIREQRYMARKRRSKTFRLEEAVDSLKTDVARAMLELEARERDVERLEAELKEIRRQLNG